MKRHCVQEGITFQEVVWKHIVEYLLGDEENLDSWMEDYIELISSFSETKRRRYYKELDDVKYETFRRNVLHNHDKNKNELTWSSPSFDVLENENNKILLKIATTWKSRNKTDLMFFKPVTKESAFFATAFGHADPCHTKFFWDNYDLDLCFKIVIAMSRETFSRYYEWIPNVFGSFPVNFFYSDALIPLFKELNILGRLQRRKKAFKGKFANNCPLKKRFTLDDVTEEMVRHMPFMLTSSLVKGETKIVLKRDDCIHLLEFVDIVDARAPSEPNVPTIQVLWEKITKK